MPQRRGDERLATRHSPLFGTFLFGLLTYNEAIACPTPNSTNFNTYKPDLVLEFTPNSATCAISPASSTCGDSLLMLPGDSSGVADPENPHLVAPLFVFLPGSGQKPEENKQILRMAAFAGYRTIGLSYHNPNTVEVQCNTVEDRQQCESLFWEECPFEIRQERISGTNDADTVQVVPEEGSVMVPLTRRGGGELSRGAGRVRGRPLRVE